MLSSLFLAAAQAAHTLISLFSTAILARVVLSWFRPSPRPGSLAYTLLSALYAVTDPPLAWIRRVLPMLVVSGMDFTPIVLIVGLRFTDTFVTGTLLQLAG